MKLFYFFDIAVMFSLIIPVNVRLHIHITHHVYDDKMQVKSSLIGVQGGYRISFGTEDVFQGR